MSEKCQRWEMSKHNDMPRFGPLPDDESACGVANNTR